VSEPKEETFDPLKKKNSASELKKLKIENEVFEILLTPKDIKPSKTKNLFHLHKTERKGSINF